MLADYLKKRRLAENLTQTQMAERIGTSQSYYSQLESGARKPGIGMVGKIARALGVDPPSLRRLL